MVWSVQAAPESWGEVLRCPNLEQASQELESLRQLRRATGQGPGPSPGPSPHSHIEGLPSTSWPWAKEGALEPRRL